MKQKLAAAARSAVASGPAVTSSTSYSKHTSYDFSFDLSLLAYFSILFFKQVNMFYLTLNFNMQAFNK